MVHLSSSSGESRLLPVVLPALILLAVTILVLIRIKLQKTGKLAGQPLLGCGGLLCSGFACASQELESDPLQVSTSGDTRRTSGAPSCSQAAWTGSYAAQRATAEKSCFF